MSLNFDKQGRKVAIIEGGKYKGKIVSVQEDGKYNLDEKDNDVRKYQAVKIPEEDEGTFQHIPDGVSARQIVYITGASGSGKSYYTAQYCKEYKKRNKNNPIFLFSTLDEDTSIDGVKPYRVVIDETLITDPIDIKEFENSLVIFDDTDCMPDKKLRSAVNKILDSILQTGRHYNISCILTFHLPSDKNATKMILNECHQFVFFPQNAVTRSLRYVLENYLGLEWQTIQKLKKSKSRWVSIFKNYPQCILTEKGCYMLNYYTDDTSEHQKA